MKPTNKISDLAATLSAAATTPLVPTPPKAAKKAEKEATMALTLRPRKSLYVKYVNMAAERSKSDGRNVSVQEIMLEVLEQAQGGRHE